jgi:hypothetical protein
MQRCLGQAGIYHGLNATAEDVGHYFKIIQFEWMNLKADREDSASRFFESIPYG